MEAGCRGFLAISTATFTLGALDFGSGLWQVRKTASGADGIEKVPRQKLYKVTGRSRRMGASAVSETESQHRGQRSLLAIVVESNKMVKDEYRISQIKSSLNGPVSNNVRGCDPHQQIE